MGETQREVEEEVAARHGSSPSLSSRPQDEEEGAKEEEMKNMNPSNEDDIEECEKNESKTEVKTQRKALHVQIRERSWFGKKMPEDIQIVHQHFCHDLSCRMGG